MEPDELEWLGARAAECDTILEVGAWKGRTSVVLAASVKVLLVVVDNFKGNAGDPKHSQAFTEGGSEQVKAEFVENCREFLSSKKLVLVEKDADYVLPRLPSYFYDMVFIDAGHEKDQVVRNIQDGMRILNAGGLLCGHDYLYWPGVKEAVDELLPGATLAVRSIWEWRKPQ